MKVETAKAELPADLAASLGFAGVSEALRGKHDQLVAFFFAIPPWPWWAWARRPLWLERALYAADAPVAAQEDPGRHLPARRRRRPEHRGAARREGLLRPAPHHRDSPPRERRPARRLPPSISTASSACTPRSRRSSRSSTSGTWRSWTPPARPTRRARTSTRRTTWNPARPGFKATARRLDEPRAAQGPRARPSPVRAVALGPALPRAMRGANAGRRAADHRRLPGARRRCRASSSRRCTPTPATRCCAAAGRETFEAVAMLQAIQKQPYTPARRRRVSARPLRRQPASRSRS